MKTIIVIIQSIFLSMSAIAQCFYCAFFHQKYHYEETYGSMKFSRCRKCRS